MGVACVSTSDVKSKISKVCSSVASSCLYLQTNQQERRNCFEEKIRNYQCTETPTVRNPPLLPYYNYTVLMLVFRLLYTELIILFPLGSVIRICCELSLALTACPCCNVPTTYLLFHGAQFVLRNLVLFFACFIVLWPKCCYLLFSLFVSMSHCCSLLVIECVLHLCVGLVRHHQFYVSVTVSICKHSWVICQCYCTTFPSCTILNGWRK